MAQKMLESLKVVSEIDKMSSTPVIGEKIFTVIARVDSIDAEGGWFYATCSYCSKELDICSGAFYCNLCSGPPPYPMIRFRVHLSVEDESGGTIFSMFNKQMEVLIDTIASKLLNRMGIGNHSIPKEISSLTGKLFVFNVKLPDLFNTDYDFHRHRVVSLSEIHAGRLCTRMKTRATFPGGEEDEANSSSSQSSGTAGSACGGSAPTQA